MSWKLMDAVCNVPGLSDSEFRILMLLAHYANDQTRQAWPSVEHLAEQASYTRRGVQKVLRRLELVGLVVPTSAGTGGRGQSTHYRLNLQKGEPPFADMPQERANHGAQKGEPPFARTEKEQIPPPPGEGAALNVPPTLAPFDQLFQGRPGYRPTASFYQAVERYQTRGVDVEAEARKLCVKLDGQADARCTPTQILHWLERAQPRTGGRDEPRQDGHPRRDPRAAGRRAQPAQLARSVAALAAYD